jgi:aconitate decarboxylase
MHNKIKEIKKVEIELGEAAFHHGGWKATRPLTSTGAQMSNSYIAATQIVHEEVLAAQFGHEMLENEDVWRLVDLTDCVLTKDLGGPRGRQTVTIEFEDRTVLTHRVDAAQGVLLPLSNDEIVEKWKLLTRDVIGAERAEKIQAMVLKLDECDDISPLQELMGRLTKNPIA